VTAKPAPKPVSTRMMISCVPLCASGTRRVKKVVMRAGLAPSPLRIQPKSSA